MYRVRWALSLLVAVTAACSSPGTAIAPSRAPLADGAGISVRPIAIVAAQILSPLELRGLVAKPFIVVRSESGEQRIRQVMISADGVEALRVESALDGSLRHLVRLGLEMPGGGPEVRSAAGRTLVNWEREVRGVPVPGDGTRVVLNGSGELVGVAVEESPLAAPPARVTRADTALRAAAALVPSSALVDGKAELAWVLPTEGATEGSGQRMPRRLAWCVGGVLRDGATFELQLDAGSLALLGWDGAP